MNKKIKNILILAIGIIAGSTIGVIGSNVISANQVGINSSKTTKTNIQDAIDELYTFTNRYKKDNIEMAKMGDTYKAIVYLDPTNLSRNCNKDNSVSTAGTKTGCMKWYVYAEDATTYTMLLDHSTSGAVHWSDSGTNENGPDTLLAQLKEDTKNWTGMIQPENYVGKSSTGEYTINYSGYMARLITLREIGSIVGQVQWDYGKKSLCYYTKQAIEDNRNACLESSNNNKFFWLADSNNNTSSFDWTGGFTNSQYWTADASLNDKYHACSVGSPGIGCYDSGGGDGNYINHNWMSLRPVITVNKSSLGL